MKKLKDNNQMLQYWSLDFIDIIQQIADALEKVCN